MLKIRREYVLRDHIGQVYRLYTLEMLQKIIPKSLKPRIIENILTLKLFNQDIRYLVEPEYKENISIVLRARSIDCSPVSMFTIRTEFRQKSETVEIKDEMELSIGPIFSNFLLRPLIVKTFTRILQYREDAVRSYLDNKPSPKEFDLFTLSIPVGSILQLAALSAGVIILWFVYPTEYLIINYMILLLSWIIFWYFSHCLAHYIVGRSLGIYFKSYFIGLSNLYRVDKFRRLACYMITLGIRVDRSRGKRTRNRMAVMYMSGAFSSMLMPVLSLVRVIEAGTIDQLAFISTITIGNILFTIFFSTRAGDIRKAVDVLKG